MAHTTNNLTLWQRLCYGLLFGLLYGVSLLPMRVLYVLSTGCYGLVYHVVGYRRKLVRKHLADSFPEKSEEERRSIERDFYRWFCDYIVETVKLFSISKEEMRRRLTFKGVEAVESLLANGQSVALYLGHYCNWEWYGGLTLTMKRHRDAVLGLIYHPLYNDAFDRLFIDIRSAHGATCVPKQDILRHLVTLKREQRHYIFSYANDQTPRWHNIHLWLPFLNHDTPVFTGGERIMKKMDDAVFYVDIERPRRGYYTFTLKLITAEAAKEEEFFITRRSFEMLEEAIRRQPAFYLWTHNRWKRTHEEFDRQYVMVNGKTIPRENFGDSVKQ